MLLKQESISINYILVKTLGIDINFCGCGKTSIVKYQQLFKLILLERRIRIMIARDTEYWDKDGNKMYQPIKNLKFKRNKKGE